MIEPLNLTITKAAAILGVTRTALSALINCRSALSPEMALRIEKAFGGKGGKGSDLSKWLCFNEIRLGEA